MSIAESILAVGLGIAIGPVALNWVNPHEWVDYDEERYRYLTLQSELEDRLRPMCILRLKTPCEHSYPNYHWYGRLDV